MKETKKRVNIVSIKLCKDKSVLYSPRKISSPGDAVELAKIMLDELDREQFIVIAVDTKNQPTAIEVCSTGTLNASLVHPREVYKMAILSNACSVILAHNHPSGDSCPSKEDEILTNRLKEAGEIIGIKVLDHLIIGDGNFYSFKQNNKI